MNHVILLLTLITIPIFISMMFMPYWTRRTESFGVSIPTNIYNSPTLKVMRRKYALIVGIVSILCIALFLIIGSGYTDETILSFLYGVVITAYIIATFLVYLKFHFAMKQLKKEHNWTKDKSQHIVINTKFHQQKLTYSNGWFLISFLLTMITVILTLQFYEKIPDPIPMQYNLSGEVTNWADKTYRSALFVPIMQAYLTFLFIFVNTIIAKSKQQISAENSETSLQQNITFRRRWSLFTIITGLSLTAMFSFMQLSYFYEMNSTFLMTVPLILSICIVIGAIILSITTGQGGSRLKTVTLKDGQSIDRDDDQHWKLGQFYFNKDDPALFLEKRFGVGWTINWARPTAWLSFIGIISLAILIPILLV